MDFTQKEIYKRDLKSNDLSNQSYKCILSAFGKSNNNLIKYIYRKCILIEANI